MSTQRITIILTLVILAVTATSVTFARVRPGSQSGARAIPADFDGDFPGGPNLGERDRSAPSTGMAIPRRSATVQNWNQVQMVHTNGGAFGYATYFWSTPTRDPFSGQKFATIHYPAGSDIRYQMNATLRIGAIVDGDTLVSTGVSEIYPLEPPFGEFRYRSIDVNNPRYDPEANSVMDVICEYIDTFSVFGFPDLRPHKPLNVKITQKAMAWSGDNVDDFILFEFDISNIGEDHLQEMYVAFDAHGGVNYTGDFDRTLTQYDDAVGFLDSYEFTRGTCEFEQELGVAYQWDVDGDPNGANWEYFSTRHAVGMMWIDLPTDDRWRTNFNWSAEKGFAGPYFSPRKRPTLDRPYRANLPHIQRGLKDAEAYYYMANPNVDYDQLWTRVDQRDDGWEGPPPLAETWATGQRPYYMVSAGPFDILPGETKTVAFAVVGGMNLHVDPLDFARFYRPLSPENYYKELDFSNFANNALWARWIYDNPGVDSDSDGYAGEFRICPAGDTVWLAGDGVPDFRADGPPQSPRLRVLTSDGKLIIRWNGFYSENTKDPFTNLLDFEGYRVYVGQDDRRESLQLLSVYDRENYDRFRWTENPDGTFEWVNEEVPFTLDSLRTMLRDPDFDPRRHNRQNPLTVGDTVFYFEPHSYNASSLCCTGEIHKVYPNATNPGTDRSKWNEDDLVYDYGEPLPKFYEYEFVYDDLLQTVPYWVSVTAYDFGFAGGNIPSKEANPMGNLITALPLTPADSVEKYELDVYIYPNPWRWNGGYAELGYENRDGTEAPQRSHRIHFANLPHECKISIFSLDGDLIREIDHDFPEGSPGAMHDEWDMINRNRQEVQSGLYYWVVESANRTQMGKLMIIR